jgi:hypothetical protein
MSDELVQVNQCPGWTLTPEDLAKYFHSEYERMAPHFGYKTRPASAVPWDEVPEENRRLMMAVCAGILLKWFPAHMMVHHDVQVVARDAAPKVPGQRICRFCELPLSPYGDFWADEDGWYVCRKGRPGNPPDLHPHQPVDVEDTPP